VKRQTGMTEPTRDWFPLSAMGTFADLADLIHGPEAQWGQVSCSCHPNCGVGTAVMVNKATKEWAPVPQFLNVPQLFKDMNTITDTARSKWLSNLQMGLALLRNYDPFQSPKSMSLSDILKKFDKSLGLTGTSYGVGKERRKDPWNFLFIAGMWFQDLWTYDFRRTEMCVIPYATQEGEISFCAYNTGIGWRNIIEKMHMTATLTKWYEEHGRHEIIAGGKNVNLPSKEHRLVLRDEDVFRERQHDLDDAGIAKTAREEKKRARDAKLKEEAENARMMALYKEHVLGEKPVEGLVPITSIAPAAPKSAGDQQAKQEEVGSFGD